MCAPSPYRLDALFIFETLKTTPYLQHDNNFGGYFGAGFGYFKVNISKSAYSDFDGSSYGPMARTGMRFGTDHWNGLGMAVSVFYKKGLKKDKFNTAGFNVLIDF